MDYMSTDFVCALKKWLELSSPNRQTRLNALPTPAAVQYSRCGQ